ncbi:DUF805 domain-containing protein [Enterococcus faecalis]|uniref:DUF805 domain-containing protein n=1 Tax=Enterococcus faecalis TaxID=1351 RepID=UPI0028723669|nr:DUF805 domain-containing protein [Enterococcus faecalis]MDR9788655.1 DUF805 domain-containing protein [Enterococcus faecalis]
MARIEQKGKVSFNQAIKDFFRGYFDFKGRTTRAGYWWVGLLFTLLTIITIILGIVFFFSAFAYSSVDALKWWLILYFIFILIAIIPSIALNIRHNRDVGLTGWGSLCLYLILFMSQGTYSYNFDYVTEKITFGNNILLTFLAFTINVFMFLLTIFPTDMLTTKSENKILRFFFRSAE